MCELCWFVILTQFQSEGNHFYISAIFKTFFDMYTRETLNEMNSIFFVPSNHITKKRDRSMCAVCVCVNSDANNYTFYMVILNYTYPVLIENKLKKQETPFHFFVILTMWYSMYAVLRTTHTIALNFVISNKCRKTTTNRKINTSAFRTWIIHNATYTKKYTL